VIQTLYEDSLLLVVNKPSGLTVNRSLTTKDEPTLFDWILQHATWSLTTDALEFNDRCGVVHRLDKETSGPLVIAKDPQTFLKLQTQFKDRLVHKEYTALVHGPFDSGQESFRVDAPIGRNPRNRFRNAVVSTGRPAVTEFAIVTGFKNVTLLHAYPLTGRTHQIRVHLSALSHPVCGDNVYSSRNLYRDYVELLKTHQIEPRMFLHASRLTFTHPGTGQPVTVEAPLPPELAQVLALYAQTANTSQS